MPLDRFMIAPINTGLETDLKPWITPDDAFETLDNAVVFRGRIIKRFGSVLMGPGNDPKLSRLRIDLGDTDGAGNTPAGFNVLTQLGDASFVLAIGQSFSIGTSTYTVIALGTPSNLLRSDGIVATATLNTTTGALIINGTTFLNTPIYFYPSLPVMGITQYEIGSLNNHPTYAFDTRYAYTYTASATGWQRSDTANVPVFHGDYQDFFWTCNYRGLTEDQTTLFVTNFNASLGIPPATDDPIWAFQIIAGTPTWSEFRPVYLADGSFVASAKIIVPFKNRLVLLYTIENDQAGGPPGVNSEFKTRARYSHFGSPFPAAVPSVASTAWLEPNEVFMGVIGNGAGFIDAPTEESIVSAEFIKDRLIVYFERSTWELVYTNNQIEPFVWQKINTELGSQATFATVPFDTAVLTIGNSGVHACSGANVERIDSKIPDLIFTFEVRNSAYIQTCGIRDYNQEMVYWSFVGDNPSLFQIFPNKILVYNYKNRSWALYDDTFTTFGYFEQQNDLVWSQANFTWANAGTTTWVSGVEVANQRQIIAGNQDGFVLLVRDSEARNAPSLSITNMTTAGVITVINHNLKSGDYVLFENSIGNLTYNGGIYPIDVIDANSFAIYVPSMGAYLGGGTIARVSRVNILTKQFNPYDKSSRNVFIQKIDFLVDKTDNGQVTVDYFPSSTDLSMIQEGQATGSILGNNVLEMFPYALYPIEQQQTRLWHPVYFQSDGECVQLNVYYSDDQMIDPDISLENFQLHAMILYTQPTTSRLQ